MGRMQQVILEGGPLSENEVEVNTSRDFYAERIDEKDARSWYGPRWDGRPMVAVYVPGGASRAGQPVFVFARMDYD